MPDNNGYQGFPIWGNLSPQKPANFFSRNVAMMIQDLRVNQIPQSNDREIKRTQRLVPRAARAEGPGLTQSQNVGKYGTNLYDSFMSPYTVPPEA